MYQMRKVDLPVLVEADVDPPLLPLFAPRAGVPPPLLNLAPPPNFLGLRVPLFPPLLNLVEARQVNEPILKVSVLPFVRNVVSQKRGKI